MLQHVISVYRRITKWTGRSAGSRRLVSLNVVALEERATPAATPIFAPLVTSPITVLVAPPTPTGSLAIPMPGQTMVRLDLIGPGESPPAKSADDAANQFVQHRADAETPPVATTNADEVVMEEELAEMLAASANA
jgi:hypothetical protein